MKIKKVHLFTEEQIKALMNSSSFQPKCRYSDLARLMEGDYDEGTGYGSYWIDGIPSQNKPKERSRKAIGPKGSINFCSIDDSKKGIRIVVPLSDIEDYSQDFCFEYPLTAITGGVGNTITKMFDEKNKYIIQTGRKHNIDGTFYDEYDLLGIRFIKYPCKSQKMLSNGTYSEVGKTIFLRVDKIPFVMDEKNGIMYSDVVLFSQKLGQHKKSSMEETRVYQYLNGDFLKSIHDSFEHSPSVALFGEEKTNYSNRYGFDYSSICEEDIIEICIKSNIAVFVHGKTGTGKTERMIALDRDLELIDFGCTSSDGFTGIIAKDFNSKELFLYEPYWYKSLCQKCEKDPKYFHLLFLEELTNAKSDVQKVAFEVTLNKTLTNSGFRLELPKNAAVVAAGNEASESRSSNGLSEPLFGRFAHVYIDTDSHEWLQWALKRKQSGRSLDYVDEAPSCEIHPAIIDYIKVNGDKVLRTSYNGSTPNADPRKWAMASKALWTSNNPNVLRAFVGEEITNDFIKFSQLPLYTVQDVLDGKCSPQDVSFDPSIRWYTTLCLSNVDMEHVDTIREFVSHLGSEFLAMFDFEWSNGDDLRILKLYREKAPVYVKKDSTHGN